MATIPTIKLQADFRLDNDPPDMSVLDRTDYSLYGSGTVDGIVKAIGPDGLVFYANAGYDTDDFSSPDYQGAWNGGVNALSVDNIPLPLDTDGNVLRGTYVIYLKTISSEDDEAFSSSITFNFDAVLPEPDISMVVNVDTSSLIVTDDTDYTLVNDGESIDPDSTTYASSVEYPDGSGVADVDFSTKSQTVTPIYTGVFSAVISTTVSYTLKETSGVPVFTLTFINEGADVTSEITWEDGSELYYTGSENLFSRYETAKTEGPATTMTRLQRSINELSFYWTMYRNARQYSQDYSYWIDRMSKLLNSEGVLPSSDSDSLPVEIIPVTQVIGGGDTYVGSVWLYGAADPNDGAGSNGDFYLQTANGIQFLLGDVFVKTSGSWGRPVTNLKGATGSAGSNGSNGSAGSNGSDGATWLSGATDPNNANGVNGDFYLQTADGSSYLKGDVFIKAAGVWGSPVMNITGTAGTDGADGDNEVLYHNELVDVALANSALKTTLMYYTFSSPPLDGDQILVTALFELTENARSKVVGVDLGNTTLISKQTTYETEQSADNIYILFKCEINRRAESDQLCISYGFHRDVTNGHDFISEIVEATVNMGSAFDIKAWATGTAGDVTCKQLCVEYKKKLILT